MPPDGYYLGADLYRRILRVCDLVERGRPSAPAGGQGRRTSYPRSLWAEITAVHDDGSHEWKEIRPTEDDEWEDLPDGLTSEESVKAWEMRGRQAAVGDPVRISLAVLADGTCRWLFDLTAGAVQPSAAHMFAVRLNVFADGEVTVLAEDCRLRSIHLWGHWQHFEWVHYVDEENPDGKWWPDGADKDWDLRHWEYLWQPSAHQVTFFKGSAPPMLDKPPEENAIPIATWEWEPFVHYGLRLWIDLANGGVLKGTIENYGIMEPRMPLHAVLVFLITDPLPYEAGTTIGSPPEHP